MTAPTVIAQCAGRCAQISPAPSAEKIAFAMGLVLLGVVVICAIVARLDQPDRRHRLHLWKAKNCGRCRDDANARDDDRAFNRSSSHTALRAGIEAPR
jgi:hypothetical protein